MSEVGSASGSVPLPPAQEKKAPEMSMVTKIFTCGGTCAVQETDGMGPRRTSGEIYHVMEDGVLVAYRKTSSFTQKTAKNTQKAVTRVMPGAPVGSDKLKLPALPDEGGQSSRNDRNNYMMRDLNAFSKHVSLMLQDIRTWSNSIDAGLSTMKSILDSNLPQAYDASEEGGVVPFDPELHVVGHSVATQDLPPAVVNMKEKLQEQVIGPMEEWLAAYHSIKERNYKTHQLGLEAEVQKAATLKSQHKYEAVKNDSTITMEQMEKILVAMQTEQDKLTRIEQRFADLEAELFNAMLSQIKDSHVIREYAAAAVMIMQGTFTDGLNAFDFNASPDPYLLPPRATPQVKLPAFMPVTIPIKPLAKSDLYSGREKLVTSTNSRTEVFELPHPPTATEAVATLNDEGLETPSVSTPVPQPAESP